MDSLNQPTVSQAEPAPLPSPAEPCAEVLEPSDSATAPAVAPSQPSPVPSRRITSSFGSDLISSLQSLMGTVVIAIFVITFIVQAFQIPSGSMENTLLVGDYLLVNKLCYGAGGGLPDPRSPYQKFQGGDLFVFPYPVNPQRIFGKRVIGFPEARWRMV